MSKRWMAALLVFLVGAAGLVFARGLDPIVSADWLEKNLSDSRLVVVDIRKVEDYKAGHIPGAVNVIQNAWIFSSPAGLRNEIPQQDDLEDLISDAGISADSRVVLVGPDFGSFVWITRVAWTLKYAGVENVSILDGGQEKWLKDGKPVSKDMVRVKSGNFRVKPDKALFADKALVLSQIGKGAILDARGPDAYFGVAKVPFVNQFGHIPGAKNLPSAWIVGADGLARNKAELEAMAAAQFGNKNARIIAYCDTGVVASGWWFILSEMLGYADVKNYDGSSEEMARDPKVSYVKYIWE